jgi:uncharacterized protein YfiM (DUF2279 family)
MGSLIRLVALLSLLSFNSAYALEFRFAHDPWKGEDKTDHLIGGSVTTLVSSMSVRIFNDGRMNSKQIRNVFIINAIAWTLWEVKDAVVPYEKYGSIGGDGFSYKDLLWSLAGIAIITGVNILAK